MLNRAPKCPNHCSAGFYARAARLLPGPLPFLITIPYTTLLVTSNAPALEPAQRSHKPIRLPKQNYIGRRAYFLTLCTRDRIPYFRSRRIARWLLEPLQQIAAQQSFTLRAYCLMPDHLHVLVQGDSRSANLLSFVKTFKHKTTFHFRPKTGKTLWQISFFDHILRTAEDLSKTAEYILLNPFRAGLVQRPNDYPILELSRIARTLQTRWHKSQRYMDD